MNIYIIRHGETNWNVEGKIQGSIDIDLNEKGISDVERISTNFKNIDVIYSSPLIRTQHTSKIINSKLNVDVILEDRIKERNFGIYEGSIKSDIDFNSLWDIERNIKIENGECINDLYDRVFEFLDELVEKDYDNVLLVTHGGVSVAIHSYFNPYLIGELDDFMLKHSKIKKYTI